MLIGVGANGGTTEIEWDYEADALVIGLGIGGLSAALRALEKGASVIGIDKSPSNPTSGSSAIGGNFNLAGGNIHIVGLGLTSPIDVIRASLCNRGGAESAVDLAVADALAVNANRSIRWLADKIKGNAVGVEITGIDQPPDMNSVLPLKKGEERIFGFWEVKRKVGGPLDFRNYGCYKTSMILLDKIKAAGGTVFESTAAKKLITNNKLEVIGAVVRPVDGSDPFNIKAKAVILACGGIQANRDLVVRWMGTRAETWIASGVQTNKGDACVMGMEVGAAVGNLSAAYHELNPYDALFNLDSHMEFSYPYAAAHHGIIVNERGERICDESGTRFIIGNAMVKEPVLNPRYLVIFDQALYESDLLSSPRRSLGGTIKRNIEEMTASGIMARSVFKADTIEGLVETVNASLAPIIDMGFSLKIIDTVAKFNAAVVAGTTARLSPPKTDAIHPISTPPFWGILTVPGSAYAQGGLQINARAEVVDRDSIPISGLYACGDAGASGSTMGRLNYRNGNYTGGIAGGLVFGVISGENATAYAKVH